MNSTRISFFQRLASTLGLWALIIAALLAGSEYGYFLLILFMALVALYGISTWSGTRLPSRSPGFAGDLYDRAFLSPGAVRTIL
jgi:hypothetical protein